MRAVAEAQAAGNRVFPIPQESKKLLTLVLLVYRLSAFSESPGPPPTSWRERMPMPRPFISFGFFGFHSYRSGRGFDNRLHRRRRRFCHHSGLMSMGVKGILAVGTDLFHIFAKAIMGTAVHRKLGNVSVKLAVAFVVGSTGGVVIGGTQTGLF